MLRLNAHWLICFGLLLFSCSSGVLAEPYLVISSNPEFPEISVSKAKMIYAGRAKSVKPVGKVKLLNWPADSNERDEFYQKLLNKTAAQVNSKWASLAFSGKAKPPIDLDSPSTEALKSWLDENPRGIAYAPQSKAPDGVTVLLIVN